MAQSHGSVVNLRLTDKLRPALRLAVILAVAWPLAAQAQTGVSEDRVSLPEGPGSLEGVGENVDINTNMGAMSHSVKIVVPQGFGAVTPSLGLSYSSGGGESVLGVGWSMPMPSIERMTFKRLPLYQSDDDFCVDGSAQLIRLPGTNPPVYRSRFEGGFARYTWLQEGDGSQGYWMAEYPDGTRAFFGADAQGNLVAEARVSGAEGTFKYMMVEKVDVFGHKEVWSYRKFGNFSLPTRVSYVFVDGQPTYEVELAYEERRDLSGPAFISDAAPGFELLLTQRLARIDVKSRGQVIRSYVMGYEPYASSGGFTRLTRVQTLGAQGGNYPIRFDFQYSQALGGACQGEDCARPFMMDMGTLGVNLSAGRATLVDINGDALPDIIDASQDGPHRFFINQAQTDGSARFEPVARDSAVGTRASHPLGQATVQTLDVNGDGFSDLINAGTGQVLINRGLGDWDASSSELESNNIAAALNEDFDADEGGLQALRFIDFNNDKNIDLMRATRAETLFFENRGVDGFEVIEGATNLNVGFEEDNLQLADMNGDGMLDVVKVQLGGLEYRLNLGWGKWGRAAVITGLPIGEGQIERAELEDINGDALADLVVLQGATVTYALNNNSTSFDEAIVLSSEGVVGEIPLLDPTVTVLFADMNANGSSDIVWISAQGHVEVLDLFPVRPNLMTRITNAIGSVTDITYTTAAVEMARDGGVGAWRFKIPSPMNVVKRLDKFDLLTDLHEITEYFYHDGFYDGGEKQFRGFERVETRLVGDETIEAGLLREVYDVGAGDTYRNGLLLSSSTASDGRELSEVVNTFQECPVAELTQGLAFPIKHICQRASETVIKEGQDEDQWVRTRSESEFDGYGNVTQSVEHGVVSVGGQGCEPCGARSPEQFGAPCGPQCLGDEMFEQTEFVSTSNTNNRWITGAAFRSRSFGREGSALVSESLVDYDGPDFVGLPLGQLDQGKVSRSTQKVRVGSGEVIEASRSKFNADGQVVEVLDPLGQVGGTTHRRVFEYDAEGLRVVRAEVLLEDKQGQPYRLRRDVLYEPLFDKPFEATEWLRVVDGRVVSTVRGFAFQYDEFARMSARFLPGNTSANPDEAFEYDLQSPASRVITRKRSQIGQPFDLTSIQCFDGRGREFQTRTRLAVDSFQVTGLKSFNIRSSPVEVFQPYLSASERCDTRAPEGTLSLKSRYDAAYRTIETTNPDGAIYGTASVTRVAFAPLITFNFDAEDTDPESPNFDTPLVTRTDGLGRVIALDRFLQRGGAPSRIEVRYDGLGRMVGVLDPGGDEKEQRHDLLGRVVRVIDPNSAGDTLFEYDAASNLIRETDERGVVTVTEYDGMNRRAAVFDEADVQGTHIEWVYDFDADCASCAHAEGKLASISYPEPEGQRATKRMGFDLRGREVFNAQTLQGISFEFEREFDNMDRLVSARYPSGRRVEWEQDDGSRVVEIKDIVRSIGYDGRNQMASMEFGDGTRTTMSYDDLVRLESSRIGASGGPLQGLIYGYDRTGDVVSIEDLAIGAGRPAFGARHDYDAWKRVTRSHFDEGGEGEEVIDFGLDALDNITGVRSSQGAGSPAHVGEMLYDSFAPNALTEAGGLILDYDEAGNVIARGAQRYEWDFMNRMVRASEGGGEVARFVYGADQSRVAKVEGDSTTLYASETFEVRDGISTLYIKVGRHRVARIESDELATTLFEDKDEDGRIGAADALLSQRQGQQAGPVLWSSVRRLLMETGPDDGVTFLHHDHLGSLTLATGLVDGQQVVLGQRNFNPLGTERADGFGYVDEYGFTGQEIDRSTGLLHFDWRYLDPRTGRWLSIDPLFKVSNSSNINSLGESTTAYAYVAGNFINAFDPTGLEGSGKSGKSASKSPTRKKGGAIKRRMGRAMSTAALDAGAMAPDAAVSAAVSLSKAASTVSGVTGAASEALVVSAMFIETAGSAVMSAASILSDISEVSDVVPGVRDYETRKKIEKMGVGPYLDKYGDPHAGTPRMTRAASTLRDVYAGDYEPKAHFRKEVKRLLDKGHSKEEIRGMVTDHYGQGIMYHYE